jgi:hypothetical protein
MERETFARESERFVREYDYADGRTIAADLGADGVAEVVGDTVVVVLEDDSQFELELPAGADATAFMNNGVLTVEVKR